MEKKIGTFLMIMLVICAVLLLAATDSGGYRPEPTQPTEPGETTVQTTGTQPTEPPVLASPPAAPASDAAARVERILDGKVLAQTALSHRTYESGLNRVEGTEGASELSCAYRLGELAAQRKMNPISGFWLLVSGGVYEKQPDTSGVLSVPEFSVPKQKKKQYDYTDEGARKLLTDLLTLSAKMDDGLELELSLLGANGKVEADQVFHAEQEGCRYAYFVCSSDRSTHILCFYLRSDAAGEKIADVEFQLLNMRHATGDALSLSELETRGDRQAAALMAAAELLMTGKTTASAGQIPFSGEVGGLSASVERFYFTADGEVGTLTNYRLG